MAPSITIKSSFLTLSLLLYVFGPSKAHNSLHIDNSIYQFDDNDSISYIEHLTYEDPNGETSFHDSLDEYPDDQFTTDYF
uniref:Uncharacterized protein n=1 Tax=Cucumis melo TaxID=3656 RepID=A0A9I9ECU2_CUCME